jgi:hypothetical protein
MSLVGFAIFHRKVGIHTRILVPIAQEAWREKLQFNLFSIVLLGQRTTVSSWLGLVSGTWGILYGLQAKQFTAYGRFSSREPESFPPNWRHRLFVVSISAIAILTSLRFLIWNS